MTGLPEVEWINSAMKSNDGNSITKHTHATNLIRKSNAHYRSFARFLIASQV